MTGTLIIIFSIVAAVCYLFIPMIHRLVVHFYWRSIRKAVIRYFQYPELAYKNLSYKSFQDKRKGEKSDDKKKDQEGARFIIYGNLNGIEEDRRVWVESKEVILEVKPTPFFLFYLPSKAGQLDEMDKGRQPITMDVLRVSKLQEETSGLSNPRVMAVGSIERENEGRAYMQSKMIVFFEGENQPVLKRVLASAFPPYTVVSFFNIFCYGISSFLFFLLSYLFSVTFPFFDRVIITLLLSFALLPVGFFMPPGIFFLYLFRIAEKKLRRVIFAIYRPRFNSLGKKASSKLRWSRIGLVLTKLICLILIYISGFVIFFFPIDWLIR